MPVASGSIVERFHIVGEWSASGRFSEIHLVPEPSIFFSTFSDEREEYVRDGKLIDY